MSDPRASYRMRGLEPLPLLGRVDLFYLLPVEVSSAEGVTWGDM